MLSAQTSTGDREDGEGEVCRRVRIQPCMDKGHACDPSGNGYANRVELGHTEACFGSLVGLELETAFTPPKFNMEPENDGFQKESPFPGTSFQVPC